MIKKELKIFIGLATFVGASGLGLYLLIDDKLTGGEFVSLVSVFAVIGLFVVYIDDVKELSIGGNVIKLKEAKGNADQAILNLQEASAATFRVLLKGVTNRNSSFGPTGPKEPSVEKFWSLYEDIKTCNLQDKLSTNIASSVEVVLRLQRYQLLDGCKLENLREEDISPDTLLLKRMDPTVIDKELSGRSPQPVREAHEKTLIEAIAEYRKLYDFRETLQKN